MYPRRFLEWQVVQQNSRPQRRGRFTGDGGHATTNRSVFLEAKVFPTAQPWLCGNGDVGRSLIAPCCCSDYIPRLKTRMKQSAAMPSQSLQRRTRDRQVHVWLSDRELAALRSMASATGESLSGFMRRTLATAINQQREAESTNKSDVRKYTKTGSDGRGWR